jgi:ABC-2 type transport system permease protein
VQTTFAGVVRGEWIKLLSLRSTVPALDVVGTLLCSTAASLTAALTVLLLPGILSFIRLDWVETIVSYLPLPASSALLTTGAVETQGAYLSAQASLIVMAAYAVVPIAAAAVTLHRRDA